MLRIGIITIMPEILDSLRFGIVGRALKNNIVEIKHWNPRQWGLGTHNQIDDKPFGGGGGMVMMYSPLKEAINHAKAEMPENCKTIFLSPQGRMVKQKDLNIIAKSTQPLLFLAGRYEGVDERVIISEVDEEWSLGDFVLSGGELAAMVFIEALVRLLPGALGNPESVQYDSFMDGILDFPHYTRPAVVDGLSVPDILLSGNHEQIFLWRRKQALGRTWLKRPDLLQNLNEQDQKLLEEFKTERS